MKATLSQIATLKGSLTHSETLQGKLVEGANYPTYSGEYEVTPNAHCDKILRTQDKLLKENITVSKVPYFETSNEYGDTVYIAEGV